MDITPGTEITIEIVGTPQREAAVKTLRRLCAKDPAIAKAQRYRKTHRPSWQDWRRGGKMWHHQMKSRSPATIEAGRKYNVTASLDVIRDLRSVERWTKVTTR